MTITDCKITPHTSSTIRIEAPEGYHINRIADNINLGKVIYDAIGTRLEDKYVLLLDNYLKPFNE